MRSILIGAYTIPFTHLFQVLRRLAALIRHFVEFSKQCVCFTVAIRDALVLHAEVMQKYLAANGGGPSPINDFMKSATAFSGTSPSDRSRGRDFQLIRDDGDFDADFFLPPSAPRMPRDAAIEAYLRQPRGDYRNRKPCSGFNPEIYATEALETPERAFRNPFAHFIEHGKPHGRWLTPLLRPPLDDPGSSKLRIALQVHAYYPELIDDFLECLFTNASRCDLFFSTRGELQARRIRDHMQNYDRGTVQVSIAPNRGRDLGPFLSEGALLDGSYDLIGHLHFKKSLYGFPGFGEIWRKFLWKNLLGPDRPMVDVIAQAFEADPRLGLVFPDDPNLVGWSQDKALALHLARRMHLEVDLPEAFDFPAGTMFWARPAALQPLFGLRLQWDDYPPEPAPMDGTILHALERLLPFIAQHQGYHFAATHRRGLTNVLVSQPLSTPDSSLPAPDASPMDPAPPPSSMPLPTYSDGHAILQAEVHSLWNSRSWRLLRPLRNFLRRRRGLPRETEPVALSQAEAIRTIIAIRQSLSWELAAPLRLLNAALGTSQYPAALPLTTPAPIAHEAAIAQDIALAEVALEDPTPDDLAPPDLVSDDLPSDEAASAVPAPAVSEPTPPPEVIEFFEPMPEAFGRITYLKEVVAPLRLDISTRHQRRVNVLVSTIDFKYLYGGYLAVFSLALQLVEQGYRVRIVIVDQCDYQPARWREQLKGYAPLEGLFDKVEVEYRYDRSRALTVNPNEAFLATSWWTAHVAHHAASALKQHRFVYLTQEYEPMFYEAGSMHAMAEESYTFPHFALFSTELLRDFSRQQRIGVFSAANGTGDRYSVSFQNAIGSAGPRPEQMRRRGARRLLFYARPERHAARNLFEMGVIALSEAIEEGIFDYRKWRFDGIGTLRAHQLAMGRDAHLQMLARVTLDEYVAMLPSYDLGVSLMLTPHPSLVPLDMAAAGMITITNTYANKTAATLEAISSNLLAVPATVVGIKEGMVRALARLDDIEGRIAGAQLHWQTRWSEALGGEVMDRLKWFLDNPNAG